MGRMQGCSSVLRVALSCFAKAARFRPAILEHRKQACMLRETHLGCLAGGAPQQRI